MANQRRHRAPRRGGGDQEREGVVLIRQEKGWSRTINTDGRLGLLLIVKHLHNQFPMVGLKMKACIS